MALSISTLQVSYLAETKPIPTIETLTALTPVELRIDLSLGRQVYRQLLELSPKD